VSGARSTLKQNVHPEKNGLVVCTDFDPFFWCKKRRKQLFFDEKSNSCNHFEKDSNNIPACFPRVPRTETHKKNRMLHTKETKKYPRTAGNTRKNKSRVLLRSCLPVRHTKKGGPREKNGGGR
jgi:hypothetical protein